MRLMVEDRGAVRTRLASALAGVEARFSAELLSDLTCVNQLVDHLERYRGKMLRPTLVLASALTAGEDAELTDRHEVLGAVVEMVHMATLVHDDVLDEADVRRRGATVNRLAGNEAAVMLGDYLISHAYHLCSQLDRPDLSRLIARATNTVCEGELLQLSNRNNWRLDERTYFEIIRRKTASLCGVCCEAAAVLDERSESDAAALYEYGEGLGVAFQIVDDVLDLAGDEATVGKSLGRDLQKGKLTLPLIRYLQMQDGVQRERSRAELERLASPEPRGGAGANGEREGEREGEAAALRERVLASGAVEHAREQAAALVDAARDRARAATCEGTARELLLEMADAVLSRRA